MRCWVSALFLLALAGRAGASDKVDIADLELESLLDPEVVSASRRLEKVSEAPASVFVLTAEEIRDQGFRSIAEALASVPGLFVADQRAFQYLGVRGINIPDDESTHVLVMIDGHPINNSGLTNTYISRDLPVTLAALERIEVIFGPAGGIYGPFAFFAVINFITGAGHPGVSASLAGDADATRPNGAEAAFTADARLKELEVFVHAGAFHTAGVDFSFPGLDTPGRPAPDGGAVPGTDSGNAQNFYTRLRWREWTLSAGYVNRSAGDPFASYLSVVGDSNNQYGNRIGFATLAWEKRLLPELELMAQLSYDAARATDRYIYPSPPAGTGPINDLATDSFESAVLRAELRPREGTLITLGADDQLHHTVQLTSADLLTNLLNDPVNGVGIGPIDQDYNSLNTYLLLEQSLGSALRFQGGLNFYSNTMSGSRFTGKLSAAYQLSGTDTLKLVWSQGFRPPSVAEELYTDGQYYQQNRALHPERAESTEGIWEHRFGTGVSTRLNAFYSDYQDLIAYRSAPAPGLAGPPDPNNPADYQLQAQNVDAARVLGGEAAFRFLLSGVLQGYGGVSVEHAQLPAGAAEANNFANLTATLALSTHWFWEPLTLSINGQFVSGRNLTATPDLPNPGGVPPYLRVNASARLALPWVPGLNLQLTVVNLFASPITEPLPVDQAPLQSYTLTDPSVRLLLEYRP